MKKPPSLLMHVDRFLIYCTVYVSYGLDSSFNRWMVGCLSGFYTVSCRGKVTILNEIESFFFVHHITHISTKIIINIISHLIKAL